MTIIYETAQDCTIQEIHVITVAYQTMPQVGVTFLLQLRVV